MLYFNSDFFHYTIFKFLPIVESFRSHNKVDCTPRDPAENLLRTIFHFKYSDSSTRANIIMEFKERTEIIYSELSKIHVKKSDKFSHVCSLTTKLLFHTLEKMIVL